MAVVVSTDDYCNIIEKISSFDGPEEELENLLLTDYRLPVITIRSIGAQVFKRRMKLTHGKVKSQAADLYYRYDLAVHENDPEGIIIRLAYELNSSPCLIAKLILEQHLKLTLNKSNISETDSGLSPEVNISLDMSLDSELERRDGVSVSSMMRDTTLIPDSRLSYEILLCTLCDTKYGSITELGNRLVGEEHERRLFLEAKGLGVTFQAEKDLRGGGFDKTPDLRLAIPIVVEGSVVNWIESKALFGGPEEHVDYIRDQYNSYWLRFGPGMVIYWFGFEESVDDPMEERFIVRCKLPTELYFYRIDRKFARLNPSS